VRRPAVALVARVLVLALPPLLALLGALGLARAQADALALALGRACLVAGEAACARAQFERVRGFGDTRTRARLGQWLARARGGEDVAAQPEALAALRAGDAAWAVLAPLTLMDDALARRQFDGCLALARLARVAGRLEGVLYEAAVHIEQGAPEAAARLVSAHPTAFTGALGREVVASLAARAAGRPTRVRDARGLELGTLDRAGAFEAVDAEAEACVPRPVRAALARQAAQSPAPTGLRATLDLRLCRAARLSLGDARATIVLLDPATGALLAAVADATTTAREPDAPFVERREPASTAKLITTTAALRAGLDPEVELARMACLGSQTYTGGTLWCPHVLGPLSGLTHALAASCNVAFANLAQLVGRPALLDEYRRYGFDVAAPDAPLAPVDEPFEPTPEGVSWDEQALATRPGGRVLVSAGHARQLADLAIGLQDVDVTPLFTARFAATFANGRQPGLWLVAAEDGALGRTPRALTPPPTRAVLAPAWLPRLWPAMEAVAQFGTATGVAPAGWRVAMKTGTASQFRVGYHCIHMGVAPLPRPRVAFAVRTTHHRRSPVASQAAREITARLLSLLAAEFP
jgi:hypothetical protein